jgi:hypothetical protein
MKFRKKPVVIEATQWFKNGDHPQDACIPVRRPATKEEAESFDISKHTGALVPCPVTGANSFQSEGKVVRYYRNPIGDGNEFCQYCKNVMHLHGWIDTLEGGHIVCPGDWIITGVKGENYPCKPDIFAATYEAVIE